MPRTDDDLRKSTTRLMVLGWLIWTFAIGTDHLTMGPAVLGGFTIYQLTSFVVIYTFGRLHNIEVDRFLPWMDSSGDSGGRKYIDREQRTRDEQEEGGTGGFVYRKDRDSEDDQ